MSSRDRAAGGPAEMGSAKPVITPITILGAISVTIMLTGQIALAVVALLWSATGLMHLPLLATEMLGGVLAIPALWAFYWIARMAWQSETDPENNRM